MEYLYNFWRRFDRFIVSVSERREIDKRPYRTFNVTIEALAHLVRSTYRDIQENIANRHPRIYRQVRAGANIAVIAVPKSIPLPPFYQEKLSHIPIIPQVLLHPPLILDPPMNKRTGRFEKTPRNPLTLLELEEKEWICYPAKVGPLLVLIYIHEEFYELGFSLCNLFELADDEDMEKKPDAIYLFGVPGKCSFPLAAKLPKLCSLERPFASKEGISNSNLSVSDVLKTTNGKQPGEMREPLLAPSVMERTWSRGGLWSEDAKEGKVPIGGLELPKIFQVGNKVERR